MPPHRPGPPSSTQRTRPTMRDVARTAGVSKALVSIVFRGAPGASAPTRDRVFAAAEQLGYRTNRPASLLKLARTRHLGVTMNVRSTFHAELVEAIQAAADRARYELVLSTVTATHGERSAVGTLLDFRCEALVLLGTELPATELEQLGQEVPVVLVGRRTPETVLDTVYADEVVGQRLLIEHLLSLGHREIVHVDGGRHPIAVERRRGYRRATRGAGLLVADTPVLRGGPLETDGRRAAEHLLVAERLPSAITTFNDHCALGVIDALTRAGVRVPGDCSVAGYDDSPIAGFATVDLTTVSQDATAQAERAVAVAVARLEGEPRVAHETVLQPRLVVRGTTAAPVRRAG